MSWVGLSRPFVREGGHRGEGRTSTRCEGAWWKEFQSGFLKSLVLFVAFLPPLLSFLTYTFVLLVFIPITKLMLISCRLR